MSNSLVAVNNEESNMYVSKEVKSLDDKKAIYNALNNPDEDVASQINKDINVVDFLLEEVELSNDVDEDDEIPFNAETGEIVEPEKVIAVRTILIDEDGESYQAVSKGVYNSVKQIINIFGEPSQWKEPLSVKVKQVKVKRGSMLTLEIN